MDKMSNKENEEDIANDAEALEDLKFGRVISHADIKAWLLSWGTADELPAPDMDHTKRNGMDKFHITNMEQFGIIYVKNCRVEGFGLDTAQVFACPFCAEPDWLTCKISLAERCLEDGATCKECGRSAKCVFTRNDSETRFEFVQTGGDDPPEWLVPKIKRA